MNALSVLSTLPSVLALLLFLTIILIAEGLVFYALYKKGYVRAVLSHRQTVFTLEAKERRAVVESEKRDLMP